MMKMILSLAAGTILSSAAFAADAKRGQELFIKAGCYQCHGTVGQGANTGPRLGPDPLALESFISFVRNAASTNMPPYSAKILSDAEMADIHTGQPPRGDPVVMLVDDLV